MQFLRVSKDTTLEDISKAVGNRHVKSVLHLNDVKWTPKVGQAFDQVCRDKIAASDIGDVTSSMTPEERDSKLKKDAVRKSAILNTFTKDSDIFETAALQNKTGWKLLDKGNTLPGYMKIPESITIPDSDQVIGNKEPTPSIIYDKTMRSLSSAPYLIDPSIFNSYSAARPSNIDEFSSQFSYTGGPMQWFRIPWGEVTLYSSLSGETIDFPVYPEEVSDGVSANYTTMPDLIYQYEPWQIYQGSGPRAQEFTFSFHRDMWTGDHRDGKANELIRACEANCYPEYRGSSVYTSTVTLYVAGKPLITGVMNAVSVDWDGPLGKYDNWYLHCTLKLSIIEVAPQPLNYTSVRNKPLIG